MNTPPRGNGKTGAREERALARLELKRGLAQARTAHQKLSLILSSPHVAAIVPTLPAEELYFTVKEVGLSDALELLHLTSPDQFRSFLDLDAWKRDRLDPSAALFWLHAARTDDDDERYRRKVANLDIEVLELLLKNALRIHDLREDEDPETSGPLFRSPDNCYLVEFTAEGAEYSAVRSLVDDLYAEDPFRAARLLEAVRWELPTELEETALRWRTARLADLGFPDTAEALSYFAYVDPDAPLPHLERPPAVPEGFFLSRLAPASSFLDEALRRVPDEDRGVLERQLVTVLNAALVVDAVDPGELDNVSRALASARDMLSLGLEHASRGDAVEAGAMLAVVPLKRIFQVGFSLGLRLRFRADRLMRSGRASFPASREVPLLDEPVGEAIAALRRKRPHFCEALADPSLPPERLRPFRTVADLQHTATALGRAERLAELFARLGFEAPRAQASLGVAVAAAAAFVHFADLYLTAVARSATGEPFAFEPLRAERLEALAAAAFVRGGGAVKLAPAFEQALRAPILREAAALGAESEAAAEEFVSLCARRLLSDAGAPFAAAGRLDPEAPLPLIVA